MSKFSARLITTLVLFIPAIAIIVVAKISDLPMGSAVAVSLMLVSIGILSLRPRRPFGRPPMRFWISLAVGALFFLGGAVGMVRLFERGWQWSEGLPLALPVALGLSVIWFTFKSQRKSAH